MNPLVWTKAQWDAAGRHVLTLVGTATPILIYFNVISPAQAGEFTMHVGALFAAITGLFLALAPLYAAWRAAKSASPESQAAQTVSNLEKGVPMNEEKDKLIEAVANQPEVKSVKMVDSAKAATISSQKVS